MTPALEELIGRKMAEAARAEGHRPRLPPNPLEHSKADRQTERQSRVMELHIMGITSPTQIAKTIGASKQLVKRDLDQLGLVTPRRIPGSARHRKVA